MLIGHMHVVDISRFKSPHKWPMPQMPSNALLPSGPVKGAPGSSMQNSLQETAGSSREFPSRFLQLQTVRTSDGLFGAAGSYGCGSCTGLLCFSLVGVHPLRTWQSREESPPITKERSHLQKTSKRFV